MEPRNPLREEYQSRDAVAGSAIINLSGRRIIRLVGPTGIIEQFKIKETISAPDEHGTYHDDEIIYIQTDRGGNVLPENGRIVAVSHSGLFITSPAQFALCTSWFHGNRSRAILLGQDGRLLARGGAICSSCESWRSFLHFIIAFVLIAVLLGL